MLSSHFRDKYKSATKFFKSEILGKWFINQGISQVKLEGVFYLLFIYLHSSSTSLLSKPVSDWISSWKLLLGGVAEWWIPSTGKEPALVWALSFPGFWDKTTDVALGLLEFFSGTSHWSSATGIEQFIHPGQHNWPAEIYLDAYPVLKDPNVKSLWNRNATLSNFFQEPFIPVFTEPWAIEERGAWQTFEDVRQLIEDTNLTKIIILAQPGQE